MAAKQKAQALGTARQKRGLTKRPIIFMLMNRVIWLHFQQNKKIYLHYIFLEATNFINT